MLRAIFPPQKVSSADQPCSPATRQPVKVGRSVSAIWQTTTIGVFVDDGVAHIQTGPFGTQLKASDYVDEGTPVINVRNIGLGCLKPDKLEFVNDQTVERLTPHLLEQGDIIFGRKGAVYRHLYVGEAQEHWMQGSDCIRLRFLTKDIVPRFLSFFFLTDEHKKWMLAQSGNKATMASLNQDIIRRIKIHLPSVAIQEEIVQILSAYDDLISNNQRRLSLLEEAARQLYEEWFVRLHFPGHEHTKFVNGMPTGWHKTGLGIITTKIGSGATPRGGESSYQTSGIPLIRSQNVYDDSFDDSGLAFINEEQAAALNSVTVQSRDILLNITGASVARCCMAPERYVPARVNQHVMIVRIDSAKADPFYVHATINSDERKRQLLSYAQVGATREALTKDTVSNFEIVLPTDSLMRQFGDIAEDMFLQRENLAHQNQKLKAARDLLLPRLMSGEIRF